MNNMYNTDMNNTVNIPKTERWFVVDANNQRKGPFSSEQIIQMYNNCVINDNTYVICQGMSQWIHFKNSELAGITNNGIPEIPLSCAKNTWAWALSGALGIYTILLFSLPMIYTNVLIWGIIILNIVFICLDIGEIQKVRKNAGAWVIWGFLLIPVYLFIRANKVDKKYGYAIAYTVIYSMFVLLQFTIITGLMMNATLPRF